MKSKRPILEKVVEKMIKEKVYHVVRKATLPYGVRYMEHDDEEERTFIDF